MSSSTNEKDKGGVEEVLRTMYEHISYLLKESLVLLTIPVALLIESILSDIWKTGIDSTTIFLVVFVILTGILISLRISLHERSVSRAFKKIEEEMARNRKYHFISGKEEDLVKKFVEIVNNASYMILATGGISRQQEYLKAIENKVLKERVEYYRIFMGPVISEEFMEHLHRIMGQPNVNVYYIGSGTTLSHYAYILLTESTAVISLPDPEMFRTFIVSTDDVFVRRISEYALKLRGMGKRLETFEDVKGLIDEGELKVKPKVRK